MKRIVYLDAIKAFAIFLVCFYHGHILQIYLLKDPAPSTYFNYYLIGALSICVPLFFMVNGALLLNKKLDLRRNSWRVLKLYFLIYFWSVLILFILKLVLHDTYTLKLFIWGVFSHKFGRIHYLWFLNALNLIYLIFPLIKIAYDKDDKSVLYFAITVIFIFSFGNDLLNQIANTFLYFFGVNSNLLQKGNFNFFPYINPYGNYFYSIFYFVLGGFLSRMISEKKFSISYSKAILVFFFALTIQFFYGLLMTLKNNSYFDVVFQCFDSAFTLLMTASVFILFSKIEYSNQKINNIILLIGKNTFGIYIIHYVFIIVFKPIFRTYSYSNNLIFNILFVVSILLISLLIALLLKKVPFFSFLLKI